MRNVLIFFRKEGFYSVDVSPDEDLKQQAEISALKNPGTIKVEDIDGNVLWELNPWKETVKDIYDRMYKSPDGVFENNNLAKEIVAFIENKHPDYFIDRSEIEEK